MEERRDEQARRQSVLPPFGDGTRLHHENDRVARSRCIGEARAADAERMSGTRAAAVAGIRRPAAGNRLRLMAIARSQWHFDSEMAKSKQKQEQGYRQPSPRDYVPTHASFEIHALAGRTTSITYGTFYA